MKNIEILLKNYHKKIGIELGKSSWFLVNQDIIDRMKLNKSKLESKFSNHLEPVMHGLVDALLTDSPTGCVLLGQRNTTQVESASSLGVALSEEEAIWVKKLYQN